MEAQAWFDARTRQLVRGERAVVDAKDFKLRISFKKMQILEHDVCEWLLYLVECE